MAAYSTSHKQRVTQHDRILTPGPLINGLIKTYHSVSACSYIN